MSGAAVDVALAGHLRRPSDHVIDVIGRRRANPPARKPADDLVPVDVDEHGLGYLRAALGERPVESLCLRAGAWKAVQHDAVRGVGLVEPVVDHLNSKLIRDERTLVEVRLDLPTERRVALDVVPEQVA